MGGRGASSSSLSKLEKSLLKIEKNKTYLDREMLTIISRKDGKVLKQILGKEDSVKNKYSELARDNITSHNHPDSDVSYFSTADLEVFIKERIYETRVSTNTEVYSIKRVGDKVNTTFPIKYWSAKEKAIKQANSITKDGAKIHEIVSEKMHKWMIRNAKKNGFIYKRTKY